MRMKWMAVALVVLAGMSLVAASSAVSSAVQVSGRTWTSCCSDWIVFNSRPLMGLFFVVR